MTATLHATSKAGLPKAFAKVMQMLTLCSHANAGWPIRCRGEAIPSQHCCDCGAQRMYTLQPRVQRGPWMRPRAYFTDLNELPQAPKVTNAQLSAGKRLGSCAA